MLYNNLRFKLLVLSTSSERYEAVSDYSLATSSKRYEAASYY